MSSLKVNMVFMVSGAFIGVVSTLFIKSTVDMKIASSIQGNDPKSIIISEKGSDLITEKKTAIKKNGDRLKISTTFHTPTHGEIDVINDIDTRPLFPKHLISIGAIGLINTQSMLVKVGYTYDHFGVSLYGGYSFRIKEWDAGIGISYKLRF